MSQLATTDAESLFHAPAILSTKKKLFPKVIFHLSDFVCMSTLLLVDVHRVGVKCSLCEFPGFKGCYILALNE